MLVISATIDSLGVVIPIWILLVLLTLRSLRKFYRDTSLK